MCIEYLKRNMIGQGRYLRYLCQILSICQLLPDSMHTGTRDNIDIQIDGFNLAIGIKDVFKLSESLFMAFSCGGLTRDKINR